MLGLNPIPYLMAEALLSDTGGVATLVGDPPNVMIGSAAGIDFNRFLFHMGPIIVAAWMVTVCETTLTRNASGGSGDTSSSRSASALDSRSVSCTTTAENAPSAKTSA